MAPSKTSVPSTEMLNIAQALQQAHLQSKARCGMELRSVPEFAC